MSLTSAAFMLFFPRASFNVPLWLLFMSQRCVSCPVLTVDAVWGLIPASVPLTTQDPSASCVSNKTTNTSGISYITRFLPPPPLFMLYTALLPILCLASFCVCGCFAALCTPACQNGGRCVDVNKCTCVGGWEGARCQIGAI